MDSPYLQSHSSSDLQRMRSNSNLSVHSVDSRGAIRKRSSSRSRPLSSTQAERLHQYALDQANRADSISSFVSPSIGTNWITPQQSPQPHVFSNTGVEPFPQWTVPTPPHSESGVPSVSIDANEEPVTTTISTSQDFAFAQPTASSEMRSVKDRLAPRRDRSLILTKQLAGFLATFTVRIRRHRVGAEQ